MRGYGRTIAAGCRWFTVWMLQYHSVGWPFRDQLYLCLLHGFSKWRMLRCPLWWSLFRRRGALAKVKELVLKAEQGRRWFTETLITVGPWSGRWERRKLRALLKFLDKCYETSSVLKVGKNVSFLNHHGFFVRLLTCPCGWCGFPWNDKMRNPNDAMD